VRAHGDSTQERSSRIHTIPSLNVGQIVKLRISTGASPLHPGCVNNPLPFTSPLRPKVFFILAWVKTPTVSSLIASYAMQTRSLSVKFCVTVFHGPHTTAPPKAFPSYVIALYWVVSFVVVRHHWLGDDY